jgi:hypothetical protein
MDDGNSSKISKKDQDKWLKYVKIEYDKISKQFNIKKSKHIKFV